MAHVIRAGKSRGSDWSRLRAGWEDVTGILTIGFPEGAVYLSPALESYLIRRLMPPGNARV